MSFSTRAFIFCVSMALAIRSHATPVAIDDEKIIQGLLTAVEGYAGKSGVPSADDLAKKANESPKFLPGIPLPTGPTLSEPASYEKLSHSVFLIGTVYQCKKCSKWHQGSTATAWCLSSDGIMVTNAHVFLGAKGGAMGVTDREGECYPVMALLGIDAAADIAIFRVDAQNLHSLNLAQAAEVGTPVTVISHPSGNLFLHTSGTVARYSISSHAKGTAKVNWMSITADYAKGSSGGPVFNPAGEVVGMVASTRSIYTESTPKDAKSSPQGQLQMVIKNCVPADAIRSIFGATPES